MRSGQAMARQTSPSPSPLRRGGKISSMTSVFLKKDLTPPKRVCFRLKEAREEKVVSLDEMEKRTLISKKYLQALEECRFRDIPYPAVYQKNFVKKYVEALGLKSEPYISQYMIEESVKEKIKKPNKDIAKSRWCLLPIVLRFGVLFLFVLICVGYLGWQVRRIVEPPKLTIFSPQEGYVTDKNVLLVSGETEREAQVSVNGQDIKNSELGQFKQEIVLADGVNTIVIMAIKKHGKTTTETRHVVYKNSP